MKHLLTLVASLIFLMGAALGQEQTGLQPHGEVMTGHGPAAVQPAPAPLPAGVANLPLWSSSFTFNGGVFPFTMVGTDPTQAGAGTSNVPVVIIPLVLVFNGTFVTPTTSSCGDTVSVISRVQNSPLFTTGVTWTEGTTVVGVTQFTDAFQRANFWSYVSAISPN